MAFLDKGALARLLPYERTPSQRIKNYYDPKTHNVWSARQFRQARAGGLTGEKITAIRKAGPSAIAIRKKAEKQGESVQWLVERFQRREEIEVGKKRSQKAILSDPKFWESVDNLTKTRSKSPTGAKARAMEEFGLRSRNASWTVGQSPKKNPVKRKPARRRRNH